MAPATSANSTIIFAAALACELTLQIDLTGGPQIDKTFEAPAGTRRVLDTGMGFDLVFTNLDDPSHPTLALPGNGALRWISEEAVGGLQRHTFTGHNIVIYFPSDIPAGSSKTLVVGREVIAVDSAGNFTRLSRIGKTTDIWAALT